MNELTSFDSQTIYDLIGMEGPQMEIDQMEMSLTELWKKNPKDWRNLLLMQKSALRVHANVFFVCLFVSCAGD